ncbi:hypothetical protein JI739_05305 [Ramlibacter sp. AW1]|uniref:Uncharacterized protein n=1 Tax=Ramlibacter aurantiacus TaxID=2801330 RepID=A0A936ZL88_9BURK|nr:hypothetical protein [Ramlibacter aurantiacus]MBL0419761.1 hypothetical protein [Ramlibacter aurantiacus]
MNPNVKFAERTAVLATLDPASVAAGTVVTTWVPVANFHSFAALINTGVLGTAATLDAKLRQATDATGTGAKDIPGKAIAQIVKASGDNKQAIVECRSDDLDHDGGFAWVALSATVGVAASIFSATLLGVHPRYAPASAFNQASVVQTV